MIFYDEKKTGNIFVIFVIMQQIIMEIWQEICLFMVIPYKPIIGESFKCDKCDKDFSQKCSLGKHQELHHLSYSKKCNQCGKIYKTERLM